MKIDKRIKFNIKYIFKKNTKRFLYIIYIMDGNNINGSNINGNNINGKTSIKNDINTNDYLTFLSEKISKFIKPSKKMEKIDIDVTYIPKFNDSDLLLRYNYNVQQLKVFAKKYKLKVTGNKTQLVQRIYSFLYLSNAIVKIQKIMRGNFQRKYIRHHGPAFKNRKLCSNTFDFLSMDEISDVPNEQFFSYKDEDGFIYGFDILSIHNLIYKCNGVIKNPFNTKSISSKVIEDLRTLIRLSRLFKINIHTEINDITKEVSTKKLIELRALTLFQCIDALGNYSNSQWFLSLNRNQLIKFLRELMDIWCYRAPLTEETKRAICPPLGNPFQRIPSFNTLQIMDNFEDVRKYILDVLDKFVNTGIDKDSKCLGAYYVLGSLTLVNNDAATSLPWLYQAVCYM